MSFANFDIEAQRPIGKGIRELTDNDPQNELAAIIDKTSRQLQVFGSLISQLDNQRKQIGSRRDCTQLRLNIDELSTRVGDMEKAIQVLISNISQVINKKSNPKGSHESGKSPKANDDAKGLEISNKHIVIKERLVIEFNELHRQLQKSLRLYGEKKRAYPIREEIQNKEEVHETTPLINGEESDYQTQTQVQEQVEDTINDTELQYHILLTEERNREINQVAEGIVEVNAIFKDLDQLVHQQGEQLDTMEDNILQLHGNTLQAQRELTKADEYQRSKGKWSCIILTALCIFVLIIVLAVVS
ncbi:t-SNARE [Scheffersomyces xylosifermentans]|uniref:t-SNARE n=1 Tax=Scheffersomyces xylosifermentans TaxID=1304137 RepID=UPI00315D8750